jgi:hypothetical protein
MTEIDQKLLGNTLWGIADQLRGAMNADDFRDYMLSFLFLRYLSDNYAQALLLGCAHHSRTVLEQASRAVADGYGIALEHDRLTTGQHVASSAYILECERLGRDNATPLLPDESVPAFVSTEEMAQGFTNSPDQREAIQQIVTSRDLIQTMVGAAGSGKTTAMAAVARAAKDFRH